MVSRALLLTALCGVGVVVAVAVFAQPERFQPMASVARAVAVDEESDEVATLESEPGEAPSVAPGRSAVSTAVEAPVRAVVPPASTPEEIATWERDVAGMSASEILDHAESIEVPMNHAAAVALRERIETFGPDELVGHARMLEFTKEQNAADRGLFVCYTAGPGKTDPYPPLERTVLSPDEHPQLYAMKRQAMWLRDRARELERR